MAAVQETIDQVKQIDVDQYKYGFETDIEIGEGAARASSEDIVRFISAKKGEPAWMLEWRLEAYRRWQTMTEPTWAKVHYPKIDFQDLYYYSAPKIDRRAQEPRRRRSRSCCAPTRSSASRCKEQEILAGVEQGAPTARRVDAVFDSRLGRHDLQGRADEGRRHLLLDLGGAARASRAGAASISARSCRSPTTIYATLNSAVFSDGSFVYIPEGVRCPMELSTYFRINEKQTGQFERTLIIADKGSYVSYLEGCTAPMRDENQLHAAVVELVALDDAEIKYSTVQNWYPGRQERQGRHL